MRVGVQRDFEWIGFWMAMYRSILTERCPRENIVVDRGKDSFSYLPSAWKSTQPLKSLKCESDWEVRCNSSVVFCIVQASDDWPSPNLVSGKSSVKVSEHATSQWFRVRVLPTGNEVQIDFHCVCSSRLIRFRLSLANLICFSTSNFCSHVKTTCSITLHERNGSTEKFAKDPTFVVVVIGCWW